MGSGKEKKWFMNMRIYDMHYNDSITINLFPWYLFIL